MKNVTLSLIAVCGAILLTTSSLAQHNLQIGIRYIPTISGLWNKDDKSTGAELHKERTTSFITAGLAFDYGFTKTMGMEADILYSRQGQEYTGVDMQSGSTTAYNRLVAIQAILNHTSTEGSYQAKAELNCIKIPILFKWSTPDTNKLYYTVSAGPQINYLSSAVYELNKEDVELPGASIEPIDAYKKVTIDGVVGFGAAYNATRHLVLSAQARFDYGFEDVEKKDATYTGTTSYYPAGRGATHNATAGLALGLSYKL
jgi:hypothetical protein